MSLTILKVLDCNRQLNQNPPNEIKLDSEKADRQGLTMKLIFSKGELTGLKCVSSANTIIFESSSLWIDLDSNQQSEKSWKGHFIYSHKPFVFHLYISMFNLDSAMVKLQFYPVIEELEIFDFMLYLPNSK